MKWKHKKEDSTKFNTTNSITGETVTLVRRWCKCGHSVNFITRNPMICSHCGHWVYPDDRYEFVEKMKKELEK